MSDTFSLKVFTPYGLLFSGHVSDVLLPAHDGEIGVLPHHENFIGVLGTGDVRITSSEGKPVSLTVAEGVFKVTNGELDIIAKQGSA